MVPGIDRISLGWEGRGLLHCTILVCKYIVRALVLYSNGYFAINIKIQITKHCLLYNTVLKLQLSRILSLHI